MVICLEQGADLHMAQRMPLPLTISSFSKIQIGFTFLVPAHSGSPRKRAVKRVRVCITCGTLQQHQAAAKPAAWERENRGKHIHTLNGPFSGTIQVSRYQKGKTNLDFTDARDTHLSPARVSYGGMYTGKGQMSSTGADDVAVAVASAGPYASLHLASDR